MSSSVFLQVLDDESVTGAIVVTASAVVAMVFLALTLIHMLLALAISPYGRTMSSPQERNLIMSPLGLYIICLLASNLVSAVGGVMEVQWVGIRAIAQGPACTTQAFLLQLGNNASALWTAVISLSALSTFMFRARSLSKWLTVPAILLLWAAMITFDGLASTIFADHPAEFFYGVAGLWCWITPSHHVARLATQYIWMWAWSLVSAVCFILVFLCVRGNIQMKRDGHGSMKWSKRSFNSYTLGKGHEQYGCLIGVVGKTMCWYPILYITLTLPISVTRIAETYGFPVPVIAFVLAAVNFSLLGVANPIIYFAIRHSLKHASIPDSPDATLRGSFGGDKFGTESFYVPPENRPSPVSKSDTYLWTPTPTTKEWIPPSPHHGISQASSPPFSAVAYAMTSGDDSMSAYRSSIVSNAPPRQVPVSMKLAQRSRSFHRPMESISTVTSSGTIVGPNLQLSPVDEGDSGTELPAKLQLTMPPAALIARHQTPSSPNIMSPAQLDKLAYVPLSPALPRGHQRSGTDASVYSGPRAISPDLNALLQASQTPGTPTGPPPPPRKAKRSPTPSVPVDVDESDQDSIFSRPSIEDVSPQEARPVSIGDITARAPSKRVDSMRTFWAAYEEPSPMTPNMPIPADISSQKHDTMRTFWGAYETPSPTTHNIPMPTTAASSRRASVLETKDWRALTPSSADFRPVDSSVFLQPSISAVGRAPPGKGTLSTESIYTKPVAASRVLAEHRRSRSFTPSPKPAFTPVPGVLRPVTSAIARYGSPGLAVRDGPSARNTPTPTQADMTHMSDTSYRTPRPQPGYV